MQLDLQKSMAELVTMELMVVALDVECKGATNLEVDIIMLHIYVPMVQIMITLTLISATQLNWLIFMEIMTKTWQNF